MPFLSLTTWSLHRVLGPLYWTEWDENAQEQITVVEQQPDIHSLLELPKILTKKGYTAVEVGHFHFPSTDEAYLNSLRRSCEEAGVRFYTLLADYGDITSPDPVRREKDMEWIKRWIDVASMVGAEHVRVIGGLAEPDNASALELAVQQFNELSSYAKKRDVKLLTENFRSLTSTVENCLFLLDQTDIGFTCDFGNYKGADKLAFLKEIIPKSSSIHAKAITNPDGSLDESELSRCLDIMEEVNYEGAITLVYDGPGDMWKVFIM